MVEGGLFLFYDCLSKIELYRLQKMVYNSKVDITTNLMYSNARKIIALPDKRRY